MQNRLTRLEALARGGDPMNEPKFQSQLILVKCVCVFIVGICLALVSGLAQWATGLWITNTTATTNWHFMTVVVPQQPGVSAPTFLAIDDQTVAVTYSAAALRIRRRQLRLRLRSLRDPEIKGDQGK